VYRIKLIYRIIGIVPLEDEAISTFIPSDQHTKGSFMLKSVPLDLTKFQYIGQPHGLNLDDNANNNGGGSVVAYTSCHSRLMAC
jgi:hypothetical protein